MKRIRSFLSVLLSLALVIPCASLFALPAAAEATEITDRYVHDFNGAPLASGFSADPTGFGMSYVSGSTRAWVVDGSDAIDGRSVRINAADMRWWNVSYSDAVMGFSLDVRLDDHFMDTALFFCGQNHIASTTTESPNGGRVIIIRADENGEPALYNYDGDRIAALERNKTYTITAEAVYGEPTYTLYVNGEAVSTDNRYADAFYSVKGIKLYAESGSSDSYILVDNLRTYTKGRSFPQKNSFQTPGELPVVTLPDIPSVDGVAVYANDTLVPVAAWTDETGVLLPLEATLHAFGGTVSVQTDGNYRLEAPDGRATYTLSATTLYWNDETVTLSRPWHMQDDTLYVPAQVFAEVLGAKVWYDENLCMVVLTTGDRLSDNVLRAIGGTFWMNGEPYYEISFNKWDLNYQIAADPSFHNGEFVSRSWSTTETTIAGAERALKELSENGFKTIRVFCDNINPCKGDETMEAFFAQTDFMYDLCDRYGIRVVACLGLMSEEFVDVKYVEGAGWVSGTENYFDFVTNPDSVSRQHVYDFIDRYVSRYKNRDTVLMWEICNEGNLDADIGSGSFATYSLLQLGAFYTDVTARIKANDPVRLVTGGDSLIRSAQWHLFEAVMAGRAPDFTTDNTDERLMALWLINSGLDVISVHGYGVGYANNGGHSAYNVVENNRVRSKVVNWDLLLREARTLGMPLYNGETGGMMNEKGKETSAGNTTTDAAEARARFLDNLVNHGVQLTHWWAFSSDRVDFGMDLDTWTVTLTDTPETFAAIKTANEALKARYLVNPLDGENTHTLSDKTGEGAVSAADTSDESVEESFADPSGTSPDGSQPSGSETTPTQVSGCRSALSVISAVATVVSAVLLIRKKKESDI